MPIEIESPEQQGYRDKTLMETFLAAKEQIFISGSVVDEEIAHQFLARKTEHLRWIRAHIDVNFAILKSWMAAQSDLEWVTFTGPGHWFECDRRHMRIGYGWPGKDELSRGLANIGRALQAARV